MSPFEPLVLYMKGPSPNPWKVAIILEELRLPWSPVRVKETEIKTEPFISLNPNGKVPVLTDPNTGIVLWESGAIIDYLIAEYDKESKLHYTSFPEKYTTRCWEHFQMSGQGPYFGQKNWFSLWHPEKLPSVIQRYSNEIVRVTGVIDAHLAKQKTGFLVGDKITYADLMFVPYYKSLHSFIAPEIDLSGFEHFNAWLGRMLGRPAVSKITAGWDQEAAAALQARRAIETTNMRFITPLVLLMLGFAYAAEELAQFELAEDAGTAAVEARAPTSDNSVASLLQKRKCTYNGCKCNSRGYQFHSCGGCVWTDNGDWVITKKRVNTHIFECSPSGDCCDYGHADDCGTGKGRCFIQD
ncbi:glutathione S-transferase [Coniochaeta sp. PMI_546]|nr:glutathione S-transferase [Coniochaeta sp. PMI_546]